MAQVSVTLVRADTNQEYDVELPDDAVIAELLPALVKQLGLPLTGPDGNQVAYELSNKRTGREFKEVDTLGSAGTKTGDVILLTSTFVAGSAFLVSKEHLDYLVAAGVEYGVIEKGNEDHSGALLLEANLASLHARYGDPTDGEPPYVFAQPTHTITPAQVAKAVQCFDYQACEYDGWKASDAKALVDRIQKAAIGRLPARLREVVPDTRYGGPPAARLFDSSEYAAAVWGL